LEGLLPSWWAAVELRHWRAQEAADMTVGYPSFESVVRRRHRPFEHFLGPSTGESPRERVEREQCGEFVLTWQGSISPFPSGMRVEEIQAIVTDLDEDRPVRVLADGVLAHDEDCRGSHRPRTEFRLQRPLHGAFKIEIAYRRPPGVPVARSIAPRINQHHQSGAPPHLLNTIDALCVLFPADGTWVWGVHGARQYTNYTAIWLAKHLVWVEARERGVGIMEAWPGSFVGHDPFEIHRLLRPHVSCRCGSGKIYAECCAESDARARGLAR